MSPATSELNLFSRSTSPVGINPPNFIPRPRYSAYDSLLRRRTELNNAVNVTHTHKTRYAHIRAAESLSPYIYVYSVQVQVAPIQHSMRTGSLGGPNKKDYIEELTKQLDACRKVGRPPMHVVQWE